MDEHLTTPAPEREWDSAVANAALAARFEDRQALGAVTQDATSEEAEHFLAALRRMPAEYQAVVELRSLEKKSLEEVAEALKRSVEETGKLWLEAFARLQKELGYSTCDRNSACAHNGSEPRSPALAPDVPPPFSTECNNRGKVASSDELAAVDPDAGLRAASSPARECLELIDRVRRYRQDPTSMGSFPDISLLGDDPGDRVGLSPHRLGRFEVFRELGRGGHGIVYLARDPALNRQIALKIPRPDLLLSKSLRRRFVDEAQAVARLDHPNIVRVLEAGFEGRFCYIVQELCDGPSLAIWLREPRKNVDPRDAAWVTLQLAKALAHAHQHLILHRDVKPGNVLLKPLDSCRSNGHKDAHIDGPVLTARDDVGVSFPFVPKLCDFGICKVFDEDDGRTATQTDLVVGTAAYMAPEQATGKAAETGPKTDVYGLGAILYEMLTGLPPIRGNSRVDILRRVLTDEPAPVRRIRPSVPLDLELICLKCLAKEPGRRYASAESLADDLEHFLKGEPISVRHVRPWERAWLWSRRHPLRAGSVLLVVFLFCAWILTVLAANVRLNGLNESLAAANDLLTKAGKDKDAAAVHAHVLQLAAERDRARADELVYVSDMQQAGTALRSGDMRRLMSLLQRHLPQSRAAAYQGGEWDFLYRRGEVAHHLVAQGDQPVYFVILSPDERYLATAGKDAVIRFYELGSSKLVLSIDSHQIEVNGLAFSPDGRTLASAGDDGTIALWEIDWKQLRARKVRSIKAHPFQVYNVLYTHDGRMLISAGRDTVIRLWDAATGRLAGELKGHRDSAGSIALNPDGKWVASAGHDGDVIVWDIASRTLVHRFSVVGTAVLSVGFSGDGGLLAASTTAHEIRIWRVPSWEPANQIDLLDNAQRITFVPGGTALWASDCGGTVHRCPIGADRATRVPAPKISAPRAWRAHRDRIFALVVTHNAQDLITAGSDGFVIDWNLRCSADSKDLRDPSMPVEDIQFVPGSNQLAVSCGPEVSLWDPDSLVRSRVLGRTPTNILCLAVSRDGSMLAAGTMGGVVRVYDLNNGGRESEWKLDPTFNVYRIAISPDGHLVAAIDRYNSEKRDDLYVLDARTGKRLEQIRARECNCAAFSPDGQWLFSSGPANVVTVWNARTQQKVSELPGHGSSINCIVFHPRARWVATSSDDRLIKVWDTSNWRLKFTLEGAHRPLVALASSACGRSLASAEEEGVLTLWHTASEEDLFQPLIDVDFSPAHPERIAFSSDGRLVACLLNDPTSGRFVRVMKWRSETGSARAE